LNDLTDNMKNNNNKQKVKMYKQELNDNTLINKVLHNNILRLGMGRIFQNFITRRARVYYTALILHKL